MTRGFKSFTRPPEDWESIATKAIPKDITAVFHGPDRRGSLTTIRTHIASTMTVKQVLPNAFFLFTGRGEVYILLPNPTIPWENAAQLMSSRDASHRSANEDYTYY